MTLFVIKDLQDVFDNDRIEQLASTGSPPVYNQWIVEAVVNQAIDYVRAALSKQYSDTQLEADNFVKRLVADITIYYLEMRRGQFTPSVERGFERAVNALKALQEGVMKLGNVTQLLPEGVTTQPTEAIGTDFFKLTTDEDELFD